MVRIIAGVVATMLTPIDRSSRISLSRPQVILTISPYLESILHLKDTRQLLSAGLSSTPLSSPSITQMTQTLVNLTLSIVKEEAALLAAYCPNPIYQALLANSDAHQELMTYVLSRIPNTYALTTDTAYVRGQTTAHRLRIETLLRQGMDDLSSHYPNTADLRKTQLV